MLIYIKAIIEKCDELTLLPYCCMLKVIGLQIGFKLSFITSVLQIGIESPLSTILDILKKGSYKRNRKMMNKWNNKSISEVLKVANSWIPTLLENKSTFAKWEQRNEISTALLEATISSAWTESVPKFLETPVLLLWRFRVEVRFCLVTICHRQNGQKDTY